MSIEILLIVAYILEPIIWVYAIGLKFERKYKRIWPYIGYILFDCAISCIEEFTIVSNVTGKLFFTLLFWAYLVCFICISYRDEIYKKILYVGVLSIMSLVSDLIVLILFTVSGMNMQQMSGDGIYNALAILCSKLIMLVVVFISSKIRLNAGKETILGTIALIVMELPSIVLFNNKEKTSNLFLITYMVSQIAAVLLVVYLRKTIVTKKFQADAAEAKVVKLEEKAQMAINHAAELEIQVEEAEEKLKKLELLAKKARTDAIELERQLNNKPEMLEIFENRKKILLSVSDIMYAEKVERKVIIKTKNNLHKVNKSITYLEEQLGEKFIRINQGTLVNKVHIEKIGGESLYLRTGEAFHIPRERVKDIKQELGREMI